MQCSYLFLKSVKQIRFRKKEEPRLLVYLIKFCTRANVFAQGLMYIAQKTIRVTRKVTHVVTTPGALLNFI